MSTSMSCLSIREIQKVTTTTHYSKATLHSSSRARKKKRKEKKKKEKMATADQTLYNSRGFQPNFIRGIVRNPMRAVNNTSATPHFKTIQEAIEHDHHVIKAHYQAIATSKDHDEQTRYQNQLTWEMARHVVGEELVLFPAFEKYLKDGGESSVKNRQQHDTVFPPPPLFVCQGSVLMAGSR
ncbi:hypothetical protein MAP00_007489 [Monascus purpureus]|nr:hypothetical protein MAP00_007489 [Monascus purpureus]